MTADTEAIPAAAMPIHRLLVANRGELVPRIARTCRELRVTCLALVAADQRDTWWSRAADEIVPLAGSYLDTQAILDAARAARADAIHPGYGFLAESPEFAEAVLGGGLVWVGPPPTAMRALGDKAAGRRLAASLGIPTMAGYDGSDQTDEALAHAAEGIGFPVLLKPSAGGGGKGMHVVRERAHLTEALARARREAKSAFGDDRLVIERYLEGPRHVEVQVLFDHHGHGVHLGERDCSLQRRHQKVVEEAPSPAVDPALRERLGDAALRLGAAAGYEGAGTVEFLLDDGGGYFFLELNARLQVEHPVTELLTGRDLVADQLRIAAGRPLTLTQGEVTLDGHAVEARLYAEDPWAGFLPAVGRIQDLRWPAGEGIRVDAGVGIGDEVGTRYDPLLAKILVHGRDRAEALALLSQTLAETKVFGITTNRGFLRWLVEQPAIAEGPRTDTIDSLWRPADQSPDEPPDDVWASGAVAMGQALRGIGHSLVGFRLNGPAVLGVEIAGREHSVSLSAMNGENPSWRAVDPTCPQDGLWLDVDGRAFLIRLAAPPTVESAVSHAAREASGTQAIVATMPGTVLSVAVAEGDRVEAHQVLVVLEAMKMENAVTAPADGRVARLLVTAGQTVQRGEALVELA